MTTLVAEAAKKAAVIHPLTVSSNLAGKQAIYFAAVAERIAENVLDVGQEILNIDIKTVLQKYGSLTSEFFVEILKTYNSIDESIQKERYKAEIIKAIQAELIKRAKNDIPNNSTIKQMSTSELQQILEKLNQKQKGGSSIKHIQKGGQQSLKRTAKSINDFLNSSVTASRIINMVKKGGRTKRRYNHYAKKYKTRRQI